MSYVPANIPVLETERLRLRGFKRRDFDAVAAYKGDPEVMRFTGGAETRPAAWKSLAAMAGSWDLNGYGYFCVADKQSDECLGHCSLFYPVDWPGQEIGYTLARPAQGKGYAVEASRAALRFAYTELGWETAISVIDRDNAASQSVARKLGATLEQENVPIWNFHADIWRHLPPKSFFASDEVTA
ncbi:MAG: GNAT family N-acetyltransferase [Pseudomonadota bacterium]